MSVSIYVDSSTECPRCNGIRAWVINGGVGELGEYRDYECDTCGHLWRETAVWTENGPRYIREEFGIEEDESQEERSEELRELQGAQYCNA